MTSEGDRYARDPMFKLFVSYVLWIIGELADEDDETLTTLVLPYLKKSGAGIGVSGDTWQEIVASLLGVSERTTGDIRELWRTHSESARRTGMILTPQRFAEIIVDDNFPHDDDCH